MLNFKPEPEGHALYVPELLDLISGLLDMSDWLALLLTCRSLFPIIASRVWREVEAQAIMDLIVETSQSALDGSDVSQSTVRLFDYVLVMLETNLIVLQPRLQQESTVDFTRFDMYAPFVKQLRVYGRTARYFKGERRRICIHRAQEGVLLPNLTSVTLLTSDLTPDSAALFWLDLFLTPSLRELRIQPAVMTETAWVSYSVASDILEKLITTGSVVESLELYPRHTTGDYSSTDSGKPLPLDPYDVGLCTQLRSVTIGTCILSHGGFAALGSLPQLQRLALCQHGEQPKTLELSVSYDSFPFLTDLSLLDVDATTLSAIMGIEQLARGLRSLKISHIFPYSTRRQYALCQFWIKRTLGCIFEYTLRLKSLSYDVRQRDKMNTSSDFVYRIDPRPFLQSVSRSRLQDVLLLGVDFIWGDLYKLNSMAFQQVISFRMPHVKGVGNPSLPWFASLPYLRHLELGCIFVHLPLPALHDSVNSVLEVLDTRVCRLSGVGYEISAEQVAR
ncbi:hypothetical protein FRC07_013368 [Ceratobasidium sp. 392]|nr:hypothetical protein FRC07_013368 [Ceratobasidium sp. 392]